MSPRSGPEPPPALAAFLDAFAADRFFEAHEALEPLWWERGSDPFLQGLILFAAAFVKLQRGRADGARRHFAAAARHLAPYLPAHGGMDTAAVAAHARRAAEALAPYAAQGGPPLPAAALGTLVPRFPFGPPLPAPPEGWPPPTPPPADPRAVLAAAVAGALADRRAAGLPIGPASWGPLVQDVARRTGGALPRDAVRAEVRRALGAPP